MFKYLSYHSNRKTTGSKTYKELFDKNKALCNKIYKDNIVWFHKKMEDEKLWQEKYKLLKIYTVENAQMPTLPLFIYAHRVGVLNEKRSNSSVGVEKNIQWNMAPFFYPQPGQYLDLP